MKRIAILSDQYEADPSYSLNIIMEEMIGMLLRAGYSPVGIAEDIFRPVRNWEKIEMRSIPSGIPRDNVIRFHKANEVMVREAPHPYSWNQDVARIYESLETALAGVDVVITHDLIYQASMLWINLAARMYAAAHPEVTWLNWVHSATPSPVWTNDVVSIKPAREHFPNSKTVFPNAYSIKRIATNFRCEVDDVAVVPHPTDIVGYFGFDEITAGLIRSKNMLSADVIMVYPARLDRGKQVEFVIRTAAAIKRLGRSARVIVIDFHSTGGDKVKYRQELIELGVNSGLAKSEVVFTSQFNPAWNASVPRHVVRDLFMISNAFVMPCKSETYSLVTQEAMLCGNFAVLNFDFPPMYDIYGKHAAYFKFSSNINIETGQNGDTNTRYGDVDLYCKDIALRILYEIENNPVLAQKTRIRKERNPDYVFKQFIEPLFYFRDGKADA